MTSSLFEDQMDAASLHVFPGNGPDAPLAAFAQFTHLHFGGLPNQVEIAEQFKVL